MQPPGSRQARLPRFPHRSVGRLAAAATLAAFLLVQRWVVCPPMCLIEGHVGMVMSGSHYMMHAEPCHSGRVVRSEIPASAAFGAMLPVQHAPQLPQLSVVTVAAAPPAVVQLQQVPSADPPPPRLV